jgi:peptidoglycan hydrolase-like protein with peptidoglycan-binding domain
MGDACEKMTAPPKTALYVSSAAQESRVNPPQQNDSKEEIQQIQEQLKKAGFDPGPMDGILGPQAMKALHLYLAIR